MFNILKKHRISTAFSEALEQGFVVAITGTDGDAKAGDFCR
jgi:hypothetical protein